MIWDFAEGKSILQSAPATSRTQRRLDRRRASTHFPQASTGNAQQADAATHEATTGLLVATDPPYYDNIGYADLSDFFYVWLRRSLGDDLPRSARHDAHAKDR